MQVYYKIIYIDNLFGLQLDSFAISMKAFRTVLHFLSFKGLAHAYLVTHNKYLTLLFFEDNDSISAKSAAKILSLNVAYTFVFSNFLISDLCNSTASCSFLK